MDGAWRSLGVCAGRGSPAVGFAVSVRGVRLPVVSGLSVGQKLCCEKLVRVCGDVCVRVAGARAVGQ